MKVLVIYATAGAGHRKAAEALYQGLQSCPEVNSVIVDSLDYTNRFYKSLYSNTYTLLISKISWLWALIFYLTDLPFLQGLIRFFRRIQNTINARSLSKYLIEEKFDYILSTHFFPNEVAASLKRKGVISSKIISIVTDFDVHRIWLAEGIDYYAVASEWTKKKVLNLKIPDSRVVVSGIPTDERFSREKNISNLKRTLQLQDNVFTVLVATGSFGIGPIEEIIASLKEFQVVVVCGHNKDLFNKLSQQEKKLVKVCGLVNNMDELMAVSDVMITKPGGLSISEALVSGLPLVFFNAIPGQESHNIDVLKEHGIGISGCRIQEMADILNGFRSSSDKYQAAQEKIKILAKPSAVKNIIALIK